MAGTPPSPPVCLALQGGGSHGAFQWGVLDRLLEAGALDIRAVTCASAGAMNAAALITGLEAGGAEGGRASLDKLWREINLSGGKNVFGDSAIWNATFSPSWMKDTPLWRSAESLAMTMSPYQFNPFNLNPLRRVLDTVVDFEAVQRSDIKLFVATTAVRKGRVRLFENAELTLDVLLASGCLPHLFQAVEIEGEPYWDGGYLANPPLWPLFYASTPDDILLLPLNPFERDETPRDADVIMDRLNEIVFNAPLVAELRAVAFVQDLIEAGRLNQTGDDGYRKLRMHAIEADTHLSDLPLRSKFDTEWTFLNRLKDKGRAAADVWIADCLTSARAPASI